MIYISLLTLESYDQWVKWTSAWFSHAQLRTTGSFPYCFLFPKGKVQSWKGYILVNAKVWTTLGHNADPSSSATFCCIFWYYMMGCTSQADQEEELVPQQHRRACTVSCSTNRHHPTPHVNRSGWFLLVWASCMRNTWFHLKRELFCPPSLHCYLGFPKLQRMNGESSPCGCSICTETCMPATQT